MFFVLASCTSYLLHGFRARSMQSYDRGETPSVSGFTARLPGDPLGGCCLIYLNFKNTLSGAQFVYYAPDAFISSAPCHIHIAKPPLPPYDH